MTWSPSNPITVYLVDDNEEFITVFFAAFSDSPILSLDRSFTSCEAAIAHLQQAKSKPDVILLDIEFPRMSGIDAISPIKTISSTTRIIMLTIHDEDRNIFRALAVGAEGYLLKSSTPYEVTESIKAVMQGGVPMHPKVVKRLLSRVSLEEIDAHKYHLTNQEIEIIRLISEGLSTTTISDRLNITKETARTHIKHIYSKLDVHTRSSLALKVLKEHLI